VGVWQFFIDCSFGAKGTENRAKRRNIVEADCFSVDGLFSFVLSDYEFWGVGFGDDVSKDDPGVVGVLRDGAAIFPKYNRWGFGI